MTPEEQQRIVKAALESSSIQPPTPSPEVVLARKTRLIMANAYQKFVQPELAEHGFIRNRGDLRAKVVHYIADQLYTHSFDREELIVVLSSQLTQTIVDNA